MESNQRFYLRRAAEERTAAHRAITPQAREWHAKLAQDFANRLLDEGPATQRRLAVLERRERRDEHKLKGYWAVVQDWRVPADGAADGAPATIRIRFDKRTGEALVPGESTLLVQVSPGGLGAERLVSVLVETPSR